MVNKKRWLSVSFLTVVSLLLLLCSEGHAWPLSVRSSHPLFLSIGGTPMISALPEDSFALSINYSSTYLVKSSDEWSTEIDLETTLLDFAFAKRLTDRSEIRVTVPVISYNSGVLDGFLSGYHDTFGFPDYGRNQRPKNDFVFRVSHNGRTVIEGVPGEFSIGDIQLGMKQTLLSGDTVISLYGYVEMPSGDADRGYGNGDWDWGILILADGEWGHSFKGYFNGGYIFVKRYRAAEEIDLHGYPYGAIDLEWLYSKDLSAHVQCSLQGSPYDLGIGETDRVASVVSFGGKYVLSRGISLELSFSEDINTAGAPDFMAVLSVIYNY